jgi:hypothetical protein
MDTKKTGSKKYLHENLDCLKNAQEQFYFGPVTPVQLNLAKVLAVRLCDSENWFWTIAFQDCQ